MNKTLKLCLLGFLAGGLLAAAGCKQLEARDQLNRGIASYRAAQFNAAIEHFQNAIQLDPTLTNAKVYLATAYQVQFIPGAPSEDNLHMAQQAIDEYKLILSTDPNNANSVAGLAGLYYGMGQLDDARAYYTQLLPLSPNDPTAHYSLAAIDWQQTNKPLLTARTSLGVSNLDLPLVPAKKPSPEAKKACLNLQQQNEASVDDGIQQLNKALELKPDYADAMQYMNLLYREKADLTCGDETARQADLTVANQWVDKGLAARKAEVARANKSSAGGVVVDK